MFKENPKLKNIFLAGFLMAMHLALTAYIGSSFVSSFVGEKLVGIVYTLGSIISILTLLLAPRILNKIGGKKFLLIVIILDILALLSFAFISNWLVIPIFILYFALNNLIIFLLDELLQIFSRDGAMGKMRGLYLTLISSAWVIAQALTGKVLGQYHFSTIYLVAAVVMMLLYLLALGRLNHIEDPKYDKIKIFTSIKRFFQNKNLARSYKINFLIQFFFSWMIIYTPIYLGTHLGFSWTEIGTIFTFMLLPFVLIPFPLGKYSDKIGERKMLMTGFFIASLATLSLFFIEKHEVWIWALALFCTRVGAATVEVMSDVYFFKHIKKEEDEFIGLYRNAGPIAFIVAPLIASLIFIFLPAFNFIFIILSALLLCGIYVASTIEKSDI